MHRPEKGVRSLQPHVPDRTKGRRGRALRAIPKTERTVAALRRSHADIVLRRASSRRYTARQTLQHDAAPRLETDALVIGPGLSLLKVQSYMLSHHQVRDVPAP